MNLSNPLPRRPLLGVELRAHRGGDDAVEGVEVLRVAEEGTAARAGVRPGDRLLALNGQAVREAAAVAVLAKALVVGAPLVFEIARGQMRMTLAGVAVPLPVERIAGAEVQLDHVVCNGRRLRTLFTIPAGRQPPLPAIVYLQGLGCASCELSQDPDDPLRKLFEGLSRLGFATLRLERSGVGDSEGPPCRETDFFTEVGGYRAAVESLRCRLDISSIMLFGHSVGGMVAPLLAGEGAGVSGVIVFGTSPLRWYDCILRSTRRQRMLAGMEGEALEAYVSAWGELHHGVCREGWTPEEVFSQNPHLRSLEGSACHGETMFGRHVSFFQQLQRVDLRALWGTVGAPVLVLHGAFDWVCGPDEGQGIAEIVNAQQPGRARYVELPGVGHDLLRHESLAQSYAAPREGVWDRSVLDATDEWLRRPKK